MQVNDYKKNINKLFNNIANKYDLLNNIFSMGQHYLWKKSLVREINKSSLKLLDLACGTADLAIMASLKHPDLKIDALDISTQMLNNAQKKISRKKLINIKLQEADVNNLPYPDNTFDAITIGFGLRNFNNIETALKEINRVLIKDGELLILEFLLPVNKFVYSFYSLFFKIFVTPIGEIFTGNKGAYKYLFKSIKEFYSKNELITKLETNNFKTEKIKFYSFKSVILYKGIKK